MKKLIFVTALSLSLTACAELQSAFNSDTGKIAVIEPAKKETKLSFIQYLNNIAAGTPVNQSIDLRFRKGKYGLMPFQISKDRKFLMYYLHYEARGENTEFSGVDPLDELRKQIVKAKGSFNKEPIMDCYYERNKNDSEPFYSNGSGGEFIYTFKLNNAQFYVNMEYSQGSGAGSRTLKIFKVMPSCFEIYN